jgi:hypothetical protein
MRTAGRRRSRTRTIAAAELMRAGVSHRSGSPVRPRFPQLHKPELAADRHSRVTEPSSVVAKSQGGQWELRAALSGLRLARHRRSHDSRAGRLTGAGATPVRVDLPRERPGRQDRLTGEGAGPTLGVCSTLDGVATPTTVHGSRGRVRSSSDRTLDSGSRGNARTARRSGRDTGTAPRSGR